MTVTSVTSPLLPRFGERFESVPPPPATPYFPPRWGWGGIEGRERETGNGSKQAGNATVICRLFYVGIACLLC